MQPPPVEKHVGKDLPEHKVPGKAFMGKAKKEREGVGLKKVYNLLDEKNNPIDDHQSFHNRGNRAAKAYLCISSVHINCP